MSFSSGVEAVEGRTIVKVRKMTVDECEEQDWYGPASCVLVLDNGTILYPSSDEEGNQGGALFGVSDHTEFFVAVC